MNWFQIFIPNKTEIELQDLTGGIEHYDQTCWLPAACHWLLAAP
jgi:hypothetical protein